VKLRIHFQQWAIGSTMLLVVALAGLFLLTVFHTFERVAEERAVDRFSLIAAHAWSELDHLLQASGGFVAAQAKGEQTQFATLDGGINSRDMLAPFLASLDVNKEVYSHYFALNDGEFLQAIGVRDDAAVREALKAPAGTWFAVRRITRVSSEVRNEEWLFLDARRNRLARRDQVAQYQPSERPWFRLVNEQRQLVATAPYLFSSNAELGVTVAIPLPGGIGVLGTDLNLASLQAFIEAMPLTENGAIAIQDGAGRLLAFHGRGARYAGVVRTPLTPVAELGGPLPALLGAGDGAASVLSVSGPAPGKYVVARHQAAPLGGQQFQVTVLAPVGDFLAAFAEAKNDVLLVSIAVLIVMLPLAWLGSRQVAAALTRMSRDSERLKVLDFSSKPQPPETFLYEINTLGDAQCVMHEAIQSRTEDLRAAQQKLASLVDNGIKLAREQDRSLLLKQILFGARDIAHCAAATLFLKTERNTLVFAQRTNDDPLPDIEIPLFDAAGAANEKYVVVHAAVHNETVLIDDVYSETRFDLSGTRKFSEESGFRTVSMLTVPLSPREGEVIGLIQLLNALDPQTGEVIPFPPDMVGFVEALAAQSAVALENQNLLEAQKELMDSLIRLIAGAIDAKSAYTGGHCERVPELAMMLAEEACKIEEGPLAGFRFTSDDEWREFRIGAWLHDCGKVTTPEFVVDKATKLETIYNRIHEVRMRFEVLLRDAQVERLQAIHERGEDRQAADARYEARCAQLRDDFAFVAESNLGGEFMAPERVERMRQLAGETWLRHFDDRLGLSHGELQRYPVRAADPLPAVEQLLADKPEHVVPRAGSAAVLDESFGWRVQVPEHLYNFGEVYNLCIGRGTLCEEERFKINEHIMQTIVMLERLPLPKHLRRVPEYAGTHHETMVGTGYPRKLSAAELSVPSRIMAIADIFEALTASDRPYKPMKTLSESVKILSFFKKDQHIDPELFDLFLTSGVYRRYAERFLKPEQIDEVDIAAYVAATDGR